MNNLNDIFFAPTENGDLTYEQVLEDVQRYFSENHASTIAGAGENDSERAVTVLKELMVQYLVKRKYAIKGLTTEHLCARLYEEKVCHYTTNKEVTTMSLSIKDAQVFKNALKAARAKNV